MASHEYEAVRLLGEGGFGKVFLIEDKNDRSIKHAMKLMDLSKMDQQELDLALQEIKLLSTLDHKHVLSYVTCFEHDDQLCIVTEFCPNGDLSDYIEKQHGNPLEEPRLIEWFRQIASAVEYLHGNNIIHRDLKVQNVFLDANMDCKLGDLGIARVLRSSTDFASTQIGTYHYMSPELYQGIPYNFKTDIWSLAVVIYELATLEKPFNAFFLPMLIFQITHGQTPDMPDQYRPELGRLLTRMMEKDPGDRPSAAEILRDDLFKNRQKPKRMTGMMISVDDTTSDFARFRLDGFLQTVSDMSVGGRKLQAKAKRGAVGGKDIPKIEEEKDDPIMELVTRTLKDMGHNTLRPAGKTVLQQKVDLLEVYILSILDNNKELFKKVCRELDNFDKNEDLEDKLIRLLGHEKFGMCGAQMLHYKNFTYNLKHMKH